MSVFEASHREAPETPKVAEVDPNATVELSVILRPASPVDPTSYAGGNILTHEQYKHRHGTGQDVLDRVRAVASKHGLHVISEDAGAHLVRLRGTYAQATEAFQPQGMGVYETAEGHRYVARSGALTLPDEIANDVVAVMGLDQRPVAKPHFRAAAAATPISYTPLQVASAYKFPTGLDGTGQTIALIELGGGYEDAQVAAYFTSIGVTRTGTLVSVGVDGSANTPTGAANGPDGEVQLDIEVAGSLAPAANIVVYFGPNQGSGFQDAISAAVNDTTNKPSVVSISWGGPESSYSKQDLDAINQTLGQAAALGITVCVASGDNGASDGATSGKHVDFPSSSPNVLGCGGTSLPQGGAEVAWNDGTGGGASGGGFSKDFAQPTWQTGVEGVTGKKRGVPDVSGDADPETGYQVSVDGTATVIGGTSAVAPLWAGFLALANQSIGQRVGFVNPTLYKNLSAFTDITSGNNNGYSAGPGWDPVTGLGSPIGTSVLAALKAAVTSAPTT